MTAQQTRFLNVDLHIYSRDNLQPILDALGRKVIVLHAERVSGKRTYEAHIALSRNAKDADKAIRVFCASVKSLPSAARCLGDAALIRTLVSAYKQRHDPIVMN